MRGYSLALVVLLSIVVLALGSVYAAGPATVTWIRDYQVNATAVSNDTIVPGNITELELDADSQTPRWAGYFGNLTGGLVLSDDTAEFFRWTSQVKADSVVCAGISNEYALDNLFEAQVSSLGTAWNHSSGMSDRATKTFNATQNFDFLFSGFSFTDVNASDTGGPDSADADEFLTGVINDVAEDDTNTENFLFCSEVNISGTDYRGTPSNFELIVPTYNSTIRTTYYFLAEIV